MVKDAVERLCENVNEITCLLKKFTKNKKGKYVIEADDMNRIAEMLDTANGCVQKLQTFSPSEFAGDTLENLRFVQTKLASRICGRSASFHYSESWLSKQIEALIKITELIVEFETQAREINDRSLIWTNQELKH